MKKPVDPPLSTQKLWRTLITQFSFLVHCDWLCWNQSHFIRDTDTGYHHFIRDTVLQIQGIIMPHLLNDPFFSVEIKQLSRWLLMALLGIGDRQTGHGTEIEHHSNEVTFSRTIHSTPNASSIPGTCIITFSTHYSILGLSSSPG
jgi:hypothetical protein